MLDRLAGRDGGIAISPDFGSPMEAYFSAPYIYDPQSLIKVETKAMKDSDGDYLVLVGYVIEPRG